MVLQTIIFRNCNPDTATWSIQYVKTGETSNTDFPVLFHVPAQESMAVIADCTDADTSKPVGIRAGTDGPFVSHPFNLTSPIHVGIGSSCPANAATSSGAGSETSTTIAGMSVLQFVILIILLILVVILIILVVYFRKKYMSFNKFVTPAYKDERDMYGGGTSPNMWRKL